MRVMRKNSMSFRNSGAYTSPGTPDYADNGGGFQKGWCSERVPAPASSRRHISAAALIPFSSGRALPSKWDDAERWITSPLSGNSACRTPVVQTQRRPKSKSGPLDLPGVVYSPNFAAAVPVLDGGNTSSFMMGSPFTTGVLVPDGVSIHYGGGIGVQVNPLHAENSMAQSRNAVRWADLSSESSLPSSRDEKFDVTRESETTVSHVVSRRDMATQMSPDGSPSGRLSITASSPSISYAAGPYSNYSAKMEVRDVQVDKGATITRQSRKDGVRMTKKGSPDVKDLACAWDVAEAAKNTSKLRREEAKISAWENLQKAKAEAAIKKLEMKLEKKRSASMDRILNKLRTAQAKAHDLRELMSNNLSDQAPTSKQVVSLRRYVKMRSLGGCFSSHAD